MPLWDADDGGVVVGGAEAVLSECAADVWCVAPPAEESSGVMSFAPCVLTCGEPTVTPPDDSDWFPVTEDDEL